MNFRVAVRLGLEPTAAGIVARRRRVLCGTSMIGQGFVPPGSGVEPDLIHVRYEQQAYPNNPVAFRL